MNFFQIIKGRITQISFVMIAISAFVFGYWLANLQNDKVNAERAAKDSEYRLNVQKNLADLSIKNYNLVQSTNKQLKDLRDEKDKEIFDVQENLDAAIDSIGTERLQHDTTKDKKQMHSGTCAAGIVYGYSEERVNRFVEASQRFFLKQAANQDEVKIRKNKCVAQYNLIREQIIQYNKNVQAMNAKKNRE
uniref:Uncharacterized protein n=1 Tax=Hydrogenovibrio crunogenus (strain DSM 25203 / XCL-2) TaxID=317025 RepID=Q31HV1_HYDCU